MPETSEMDLIEEPATYSDAIASSSDEEMFVHQQRNAKRIMVPKQSVATFASIPVKERHEAFIRESVEVLLKEAVFDGTNRKNRVLEWHDPSELRQLMDLDLQTLPSSHEDLMEMLKKTIKYSVKTGHPYFVNQLFSSLDPYGLVGQWLTDALNPSIYTYEVSPVFILMEETVLREMRKIVGFEDGRGDGIFCPGGSIANGYAISCARHKLLPDIKVILLKLKTNIITH